MIRTVALGTALAAGLALPAIAAEVTEIEKSKVAVHSAELANDANAKQALNILAQKGYVNVAISGRDDDGRYTGTALKDGKTVYVAVELPKTQKPASN